jgi:hypothetical protein
VAGFGVAVEGVAAAEVGVVEGVAAAEVGAFGGAGAGTGGSGGAESDGDRAVSDLGSTVAGTAAPAGSTESRVFISSTR